MTDDKVFVASAKIISAIGRVFSTPWQKIREIEHPIQNCTAILTGKTLDEIKKLMLEKDSRDAAPLEKQTPSTPNHAESAKEETLGQLSPGSTPRLSSKKEHGMSQG